MYTFDFSAVTTPGSYFVYLSGVGVSDTFIIANDALDFAAYTIARGLFYQVCVYVVRFSRMFFSSVSLSLMLQGRAVSPFSC